MEVGNETAGRTFVNNIRFGKKGGLFVHGGVLLWSGMRANDYRFEAFGAQSELDFINEEV